MPQDSDDRLRRSNAAPRNSASAEYPDELIVDVSAADGMRSPVDRQRLAELAIVVLAEEEVRRAEVSISLVSPEAIAVINSEHLGHEGPTDVITFELGTDPTGSLIADIYICPAVARTEASARGVSIREEIARLVIHGVLHACGYEHPEENREASDMWQRQEQLLRTHFLEGSG